jgi:hypothetical protein
MYVYNTGTQYWDLVTKNVLIDDCESAWTAKANVTATASTSWCRYGSKSSKLVVAAAFTTGILATFDISSIDLSGYTYIHFYIKSTISLAAGDLQIMLDNTSACASPIETIDLPALTANTPQEIEVVMATPASCTAIISVGLKATTDFGACDIYIDDIRAVRCQTGSKENRLCCESIYNSLTSEMYFLVTNGVDYVQYWTGAGNWDDLLNYTNKPKIIKNFYNYLVAMNINIGGNQFPQRIEWCVNTKPTDWSGAGSGNNSLAASTGEIMNCEIMQSQLAILIERSIAMMYMVGGSYAITGTTVPFEFNETKILETGMMVSGSLQSFGDSLVFLGWDDFYVFDGFSCTAIGGDIIVDFLDSINPAKIYLIHSHIFEETTLYAVFVPSTASDVTNTVWLYNYASKTWVGVWEFYNSFVCNGYFETIDAKTIGELLDKIGTFAWRIGSKSLNSLAALDLFGDSNGYIYQIDGTDTSDNGNAITSYVNTKEYLIEVNKFTRYVELFIFGVGTSVDVFVSVDSGTTFVKKDTVSFTSNKSTPCISRKIDTTSTSIMIKLQNNTLNGWFELIGWSLGRINKEGKRI